MNWGPDEMKDKLDYYDFFGIVIPGVTLLVGAWVLLQVAGFGVVVPSVPQSIAFTAFLIIGIVVGHLNQTLASVLEPVYEWTWGGKPSDQLLGEKRRFRGFDVADGLRVRDLLLSRMQMNHGADETSISVGSLFSYAMRLVNKTGYPRVARFNALYAYHRGMLTSLLCLMAISLVLLVRVWVVSGEVPWPWGGILVCMLGACVLVWYRTRQRGYYFVREVLWMAEEELLTAG